MRAPKHLHQAGLTLLEVVGLAWSDRVKQRQHFQRGPFRTGSDDQWTLLRAAAIACALVVAAAASPAWAATYVWTGAGGNVYWSNDSNWQGGMSPGSVAAPSPKNLVFPAGAAQASMVNDLSDTFASLKFEAPYTVSGNTIYLQHRIDVALTVVGTVTVSAPIVMNQGGLPNRLTMNTNARLELTGAISGPSGLEKEGTGTLLLAGGNTYQGNTVVRQGVLDITHAAALGSSNAGTTVFTGGQVLVTGNSLSVAEPLVIAGMGIAGGSGALQVAGNNNVFTNVSFCCTGVAGIYVNTGRTAVINDGIAGNIGFVKRGTGTLVLGGAANNTYTGLATVQGGTLVLDKPGLVAVPASLVVENGEVRLDASNAILGTVTLGASATLNMNGMTDTIDALNGSGALILGNGVLSIVSLFEPSVFSGTIAGTGSIRKLGTQTLTLSGAGQTFTGTLDIVDGTVQLEGAVLASTVLNSGDLKGYGTVGPLFNSNGEATPGILPAPGILSSQSVSFDATAAFTVYVGGSTPGAGYSQLQVNGSVTLDNALLTVISPDTGVAAHGPMVIIDNDGNDPVNGTFGMLPEGAIVTGINDKRFHISYVGGTGNDVVLTPVLEYHLSEGATGAFFDTDLLIANPNATDASVDIQFLKPGGAVVTQATTVPALSRRTIRVDEISGLEATEVSTIVSSSNGLPLVVERTMRWNESGYGAHTEKAVSGAARQWLFAEGSQGFFSTYLLLANPQPQANTATVTYLREGSGPIARTYPLEPFARLTVDAGADPDLVNQSFGMIVEFDEPGVAERAMYFGLNPLWKAGHESAGVPEASTAWFLAEGATGSFFETFVLLANPSATAADVTMTYLPDTGIPVVTTKTVPARGRLTINIEAENPALQNAAVATRIQSTDPIVVERAQYWPDPAPQWFEAHNSFGVTAPATSWGLAEGRVGGPEEYQTYILLANPGNTSANVTLTFLREGQPAFDKTFTVAPTSRFTISTGPGSLVPELQGERFGARIVSDQPMVVERAMYSNAGGQQWSAGTNAVGTRLP